MSIREHVKRLKSVILGEQASAEYIARGWALGMFIGCAIPFGLQLLVSVPLSFKLRCSKVGATVGTLITNPLTIVFIYPIQTWVGSRILGMALSWSYIESTCSRLAHVSLFSVEGWHTLSEIGLRVLSGYFLGGLLLAFICTPVTYFCIYALVRKHAVKSSCQ